jgi:hypothetical protein
MKTIKKVMFYGVLVLALVGCFKLLELQETHERNNAIKRCGTESNLVVHTDNSGDHYYTCKIEK